MIGPPFDGGNARSSPAPISGPSPVPDAAPCPERRVPRGGCQKEKIGPVAVRNSHWLLKVRWYLMERPFQVPVAETTMGS